MIETGITPAGCIKINGFSNVKPGIAYYPLLGAEDDDGITKKIKIQQPFMDYLSIIHYLACRDMVFSMGTGSYYDCLARSLLLLQYPDGKNIAK